MRKSLDCVLTIQTQILEVVKENISRKLEALKRSIVGIGCSAHIVHNLVQPECVMLLFDLEVLVIKIYKPFHIFTFRVAKLHEF